MTDKATEIATLLAPTVAAMGLELLGAEYLPAPGGATLRLYIDVLPVQAAAGEAVTIDDCERVSREVSAQLDVEDPISGNYVLEVSSPGVDRPLFTLEQFARHLGASVKIGLRLPQEGRRRLQGQIVRVDEDEVHVQLTDGADIAVAFDNIDKARLIPDWEALGLAPRKPGKGPGKRKNPQLSNEPAADVPRPE